MATQTSQQQEYKLKDLSSAELQSWQDGDAKEAEVEGIDGGKVLLLHNGGKLHAMSPNCTHYGAPLKNGVASGKEGRLVCPWHGACFHIETGDVEDAPALDPLAKFDVLHKGGSVYILGDENTIKSSRRTLNISCAAQPNQDRVVIVGGGSGALGAVESLRINGFKGPVTVIAREGVQPYDRTKLSKALLDDISKVAWRSRDYYKSASVEILSDEATSIDFEAKSVNTKSGGKLNYRNLILAPGGTPRSLPLPGLKLGELKNVFLLRGLEHTRAINAAVGLGDPPKKIVVIGSSFIGLEVGNALMGKGHDVTVIGMEDVPAKAVFGAKVGQVLLDLLKSRGLKFKLGASVSHASPSSTDSSTVGAVHLKDGTKLDADAVIEGVGVSPATQFLKDSKGAPNLEKDGSIAVDENFKIPNLPGVYAIGDIATYPYRGNPVRIEHWNVAQNAGRAAAHHIASAGNAKPRPFTPIFWSALGMQLRYCGNASGGFDDVIIKGKTDPQGPAFAAFYTRGDEVVAVLSMGKDPVMSKSALLMRKGEMVGRKQLLESDEFVENAQSFKL